MRGTIDWRDVAAPAPVMVARMSSVNWSDDTTARPGWRIRYATAGGRTRALDDVIGDFLAPCWVAVTDDPGRRPPPGSALLSAVHLVRAVIQRNDALVHPGAEFALLDMAGLHPAPRDRVPGEPADDMTCTSHSPSPISVVDAMTNLRHNPILGRGLDSTLHFATDSLRAAAGLLARCAPVASRWTIPNAPVAPLLRSAGLDAAIGEDSNVDFLVAVPGEEPWIIVVDGARHVDRTANNTEHLRLLSEVGYHVEHIAVRDLATTGAVLFTRMEQRPVRGQPSIDPLMWGPIQVHRLVLAIAEARLLGVLFGDEWCIELDDPTGFAMPMIAPYLDLIAAADVLDPGSGLAPRTIVIKTADGTFGFVRNRPASYHAIVVDWPTDIMCRIHLDCFASPAEPLPTTYGVAHVVVRTAGPPIHISADPMPPVVAMRAAQRIHLDDAPTTAALTVLLQTIAARRSFRGDELMVLREHIRHDACIVDALQRVLTHATPIPSNPAAPIAVSSGSLPVIAAAADPGADAERRAASGAVPCGAPTRATPDNPLLDDLNRLAAANHCTAGPWFELWDRVAATNEAAQLRVACSELLAGRHHDNPWLRASRSLGTLLMDDDCDLSGAEADLAWAIRGSQETGLIDLDTVTDMLDYIIARCATLTVRPQSAVVALSAAHFAQLPEERLVVLEAQLEALSADPGFAILRFHREMQSTLRSLRRIDVILHSEAT